MPEAVKIKPSVEEISLALQPANLKKFLLFKEEGDATESTDTATTTTTNEYVIQVVDKLRKYFVQEDDKMEKKKEMITQLVEGDAYPFTKDQEEWLDAQGEELLKSLVDMKKEEVDVDEIKQEVRKELEEEMKKEEKDALIEKDEILSTMQKEIETLQKQAEVMSEQLVESNTKLEKAEDERQRMEFRAFVKEHNVPGDFDEVVETLVVLKKSLSEEQFERHVKVLKSAGEALTKSGLFAESGSSTGESGDTAYMKLQKAKQDLMEKEGMSEGEAWKNACKAHPDLYKQYTKESRRVIEK